MLLKRFVALTAIIAVVLSTGTLTPAFASPSSAAPLFSLQGDVDVDCDGIPDFLDPEILPVGDCPETDEPAEPGGDIPDANEEPVNVQEPAPQPVAHAPVVYALPETGTGSKAPLMEVAALLILPMLLLAAFATRSHSHMS